MIELFWFVHYKGLIIPWSLIRVQPDPPNKTAEELLIKDLASTVACVNRVVKVALTQNQFDTCVSLAFNIGVTAFSKSTLVRRLNETPLQFLRWNKFKRKTLAGLTGRRKVEKKLFIT